MDCGSVAVNKGKWGYLLIYSHIRQKNLSLLKRYVASTVNLIGIGILIGISINRNINLIIITSMAFIM